MIEWISLGLSIIALIFAFLWRSAPNSLLVRQVAELGHEIRHLTQDFELLETRFVALAGKVNTAQRKTQRKEDPEDELSMLTPEQKEFIASTIEYQNMQKYKKEQSS